MWSRARRRWASRSTGTGRLCVTTTMVSLPGRRRGHRSWTLRVSLPYTPGGRCLAVPADDNQILCKQHGNRSVGHRRRACCLTTEFRRQGREGVSTLLADQFFLIAHEDRTGRSRLHPRATGLGLAACPVREPGLEGRVRAVGGELAVVSRRPPGDLLAHNVLDLLVAQPQHRDLRI